MTAATVLEMVARFLIGGAVVSAFAALAEIFRFKSFAGLFSAAPSIALATGRSSTLPFAIQGLWFWPEASLPSGPDRT